MAFLCDCGKGIAGNDGGDQSGRSSPAGGAGGAAATPLDCACATGCTTDLALRRAASKSCCFKARCSCWHVASCASRVSRAAMQSLLIAAISLGAVVDARETRREHDERLCCGPKSLTPTLQLIKTRRKATRCRRGMRRGRLSVLWGGTSLSHPRKQFSAHDPTTLKPTARCVLSRSLARASPWLSHLSSARTTSRSPPCAPRTRRLPDNSHSIRHEKVVHLAHHNALRRG